MESTDRSIPVIPEELTAPLPRKVSWSGTAYGGVAAFVLFCFVFPGIAIVWRCVDGANEIQHRTVLRQSGRVVIGTVTHINIARGGKTYIHYSFTVGGTVLINEARLADSSHINLEEGDRIPIRFLPSDPTINHPDAWEWSPLMDLDWMALVVFFEGVGVVAVIVLFRERTLLRYGKVAEGIVADCTPTKGGFQIDYEFRTADGDAIRSSSSRTESREVGDTLWILYMPKNPTRNAVYPLSEFEVID